MTRVATTEPRHRDARDRATVGWAVFTRRYSEGPVSQVFPTPEEARKLASHLGGMPHYHVRRVVRAGRAT